MRKLHFNTAGPNIAELYYSIDPLTRIDLAAILDLIDQRRYFVLHAPRQTRKTKCLLALVCRVALARLVYRVALARLVCHKNAVSATLTIQHQPRHITRRKNDFAWAFQAGLYIQQREKCTCDFFIAPDFCQCSAHHLRPNRLRLT